MNWLFIILLFNVSHAVGLLKLKHNVPHRGGQQRRLGPSLHDRPSQETWPSETKH
jgi:hypothetical protein